MRAETSIRSFSSVLFMQVIGVIYRSTPYLFEGNSTSLGRFTDFIVNVFGFAMPFPVCLHENLPVVVVALLGYIPPLLAIITAVAYYVWLVCVYY